VTVEMEYLNLKAGAVLVSGFSFLNDQGVHLFVSCDWFGEPRNEAPKRRASTAAVASSPATCCRGQVRVVAEVSTGHPVYQIIFWSTTAPHSR